MLFKLLITGLFAFGAGAWAHNPYTPPGSCPTTVADAEKKTELASNLDALSVVAESAGGSIQTYSLGETRWAVHYIQLPEGHSIAKEQVDKATLYLSVRELGPAWKGVPRWLRPALPTMGDVAGSISTAFALRNIGQILNAHLSSLAEPMSAGETAAVATFAAIEAAFAVALFAGAHGAKKAANFVAFRDYLAAKGSVLTLGYYTSEHWDRLHMFFTSGLPRK